MRYFFALIIIALLLFGGYYIFTSDRSQKYDREEEEEIADDGDLLPREEEEEPEEEEVVVIDTVRTLGASVNNRDIVAHHYGTGPDEILFVGGIHGGYSWNSVLLSYEIMDYLEQISSTLPQNIKVTVIPVLNPDGLSRVVNTSGRFSPADVSGNTSVGRFNANGVDLNRNFDCDWKPSSYWREAEVNAGSFVFSEPESLALRDYVRSNKPVAVVVFYSAEGGVYVSGCGGVILPETNQLMNIYANASGYPAKGSFTSYEISGDATDWMSKIGIPAISVLLSDHRSTEWAKNRSGVKALIDRYGN